MKPPRCTLPLFLAIVSAAFVAGFPPRARTEEPAGEPAVLPPPAPAREPAAEPFLAPCGEDCPLIISVDGAGDFRGQSRALCKAVREAKLPLAVRPLCWSHGYRRVVADQADDEHMEMWGQKLACKVMEIRQTCPDRALYLFGHSAGAGVVLAASKHLPPDSVDQVVFLGPTVSAYADLRPLLRAARCGLDVYYSKRDLYGGLTAWTLIGEDGYVIPRTAARQGFRVKPCCPGDCELFAARLRQYRWERCVRWTGYTGSHLSIYEKQFLYAYVFPRLCKPACGPVPGFIVEEIRPAAAEEPAGGDSPDVAAAQPDHDNMR